MALVDDDMSRNDVDQVKTLEQASGSYDESLPSPLAHELAHPAARTIHNLLAFAKFRAIAQPMAREEAVRTYTSLVNASMARAAEQALSEAFQIY